MRIEFGVWHLFYQLYVPDPESAIRISQFF